MKNILFFLALFFHKTSFGDDFKKDIEFSLFYSTLFPNIFFKNLQELSENEKKVVFEKVTRIIKELHSQNQSFIYSDYKNAPFFSIFIEFHEKTLKEIKNFQLNDFNPMITLKIHEHREKISRENPFRILVFKKNNNFAEKTEKFFLEEMFYFITFVNDAYIQEGEQILLSEFLEIFKALNKEIDLYPIFDRLQMQSELANKIEIYKYFIKNFDLSIQCLNLLISLLDPTVADYLLKKEKLLNFLKITQKYSDVFYDMLRDDKKNFDMFSGLNISSSPVILEQTTFYVLSYCLN